MGGDGYEGQAARTRLIHGAIAKGAAIAPTQIQPAAAGLVPPALLPGRSMLTTIDDGSPMSDGAMQDFPLTLDRFLAHAAKWHPRAEVVTAREDGAIDRVGYAELRERSLRVSAVLADLGVAFGDRVATLAWNTQAHVEAWYAIMGMGAICHTLNPRLTGSQLGGMAAQGNCRVLVASADLAPLAGQIVEHATQIEQVVIIDGPAEAVKGGRERPVTMALEPAMVQARGAPTWGGIRRVFALGSLLHIRYDGGAEGRDLYPSIELSSYAQAAAGRCLRPHLG